VPTSHNDRSVYRVVYPVMYPIALLPYVLLEGASVSTPVLDLSEEGLRYRLPIGAPPPEAGIVIAGELRAHDAPPHPIHGQVVRTADGAVAIRLDAPGLPFSLLLREQRAVIVWQRSRAVAAITRRTGMRTAASRGRLTPFF
jgi:hypothetical protein